MNTLLEKLLVFGCVRRAYKTYLEKSISHRLGKYLLSEARDIRRSYESAEERPLSFTEMMGIYTYYAQYAGEVFAKIDQIPMNQTKIQDELTNINVSYDSVKEGVPDLTNWQFQHFKLKCHLDDCRGMSVEQAGMQYSLLMQAALMGILAEIYKNQKGRFPSFLETPTYSNKNGVAISYRSHWFKKDVLRLDIDVDRVRE